MKILDKDYVVRYNLRSMFVFEQITEKAFEVKTMMDEYILLYSCIVSVKDNPSLDFEEFIDYCSDHPEVLTEFSEYMQREAEKRQTESKKKVRKKKN